VECWLQDDPSQFDYGPLLRWLSEEAGVDADAEAVGRAVRASTWELAGFDWRDEVPRAWRRSYDVVACHFFAESATDDEADLVAFLAKLGQLGRPGATLLTSFICRSSGYTIQQRDFPAFGVDEDSIPSSSPRSSPTPAATLRSSPRTSPTRWATCCSSRWWSAASR
jgi:hypothetical protein